MRTQEEIGKRIVEVDDGFMNFAREVLLGYCTFETAKPHLKEEYANDPKSAADWNSEQLDTSDHQSIRTDMATYMREYGWPKCQDHRGISASRTIDKMGAWLWLLGDDKTIAAMEDAPYENYGAPKLAVICKAYDLPIPQDEATQNMIRQERCGADYSCGCGT